MINFDHKQLLAAITELGKPPSDNEEFAKWIKANSQLEFMQSNAKIDDIVIYACGYNTFIHSLIVPNDRLTPLNHEDLLKWSCDPYSSFASYVTGGGSDKVRIERGLSGNGSNTLDGAVQLVFGRTFEGWKGTDRSYLEINQEYSHLTEAHWRPESKAYCRYNDKGDLYPVVSITDAGKDNPISLVSFKWQPLEEYMVASDSSLLRLFDFTLFRKENFFGWSKEPEEQIIESDNFFYRRKIDGGYAAYTRGVQIIRPRQPAKQIHKRVVDSWFGRQDRQFVAYIAWDWRNDLVTEISTNPSASTNYFEAEGNSLPYELSPAFFRPEVLLKYKTDRDKYTVGERKISCRAAWQIKGIDVNEAGQIHAYIVDLRSLPYEEQLHWLSFNEKPKTGISKRAIIADFEGNFSNIPNPLEDIISIVQTWNDKKVEWWSLRDIKLLDYVNVPLTASRDDWAESFMDLSKLVVEGFETKGIRRKLDEAQISYSKEEKTISLIEKLLNKKLTGLRTVQDLRSKAKGHAGGRDAETLTLDALTRFETYSAHFKHICAIVVDELKVVEGVLV